MANTHDYNLANATGSNFRTDLNNVLAEIQALNAGTSAPTTTVAYKLWADTTNNLLKMRNAANNDWIELGSLTAANLGLAKLASPSFTGTLTSAGDIVCSGTGSLQVPVGTTAQRPTGATGDFRFNSTLTQFEGYDGTSWAKVGGVPTGSVTAYAASTVPTGWLECNGAAISRTTYASLFSIISTTYGAGNGSSTFNLPELRGEFMRGWDNSRGIDSGRGIGNAQAQSIEAHTHTYDHRVSGTTRVAKGGYGENGTTDYGANQTDNTSSYGSTETRPRNIAMMYIIKF